MSDKSGLENSYTRFCCLQPSEYKTVFKNRIRYFHQLLYHLFSIFRQIYKVGLTNIYTIDIINRHGGEKKRMRKELKENNIFLGRFVQPSVRSDLNIAEGCLHERKRLEKVWA